MPLLRIRELREALGLTQAEVAERAGFSKNYFSELERGKKPVSTRRLEQIAKALGCEPRDLLGSNDPATLTFIEDLEKLSPQQRKLIHKVAAAMYEVSSCHPD